MSGVSSSSRSPLRDLLKEPTIAVGVTERGEREIAPTLGVRARCPALVAGVVEHTTRVVKCLTDVDSPADQFRSGRLNVGHYEVEILNRTRLGRCDSLTDDNRALRTRRCQLDHSEILTDDEVGILTKSRFLIEALRPINIGDR
jgi:hypothetical protein